MRLQERFLVLGGEAQHRQHLVAAARAIDQPALRVGGGQRAQRIGARHVQREQPAVILDGRVLVAGAIVVQGGERLARRQLLGIERDDLLERLDGGDGSPSCGASSPWRCHSSGATAARGRVAVRRRQPGERASQLLRQPEALRQLVAQLAQRDQRGLVLRILDQRLLQQLGCAADVAALGHQQRGLAAAHAALLRILDQLDEQRRGLGGGLARAGRPLQLQHLLEQRDLLLARARCRP